MNHAIRPSAVPRCAIAVFMAAWLAAGCKNSTFDIGLPDHVVEVYGGNGVADVTWDIDNSTCKREPSHCTLKVADAGGGGSYNLFVTALPGWHHTGWGGDCAGATPRQPCHVAWAVRDHRDSVTVRLAYPFEVSASGKAGVVQGGVTTHTVQAHRAPGFTGPITCTIGTPRSLPATVSAVSHPSPGVDEWVVTIDARSETGPEAAHNVFITVSGGGHTDHEGSVRVTVSPPAVAFSLIAFPDTVIVTRGASAGTQLVLNRTTLNVDSVRLQEPNRPSGVTVTHSSNPVVMRISNMTIDVAPTVTAGFYTFDIEGTWQTSTSRASLTLNVRDPDYQLTASPSTLTIPRGGARNLAINIDRLSTLIQAVNLSTQNEPNGIKATFANNPEPRSPSDVTVSVSSAVAAGTYTFQVLGEALGVRRSVDVTVIVTDPTISISLGPSPLTLQAGGPANQALLVIAGLGGGYQQQSATVTFPNLPSGVTATVTPQNNYSSSNLIISLTASSGAKVGTFSTVVQVVIAGVTYSLPLTLTIQAPLTDFELVPPAGTTTVKRGAQVSSHTVTILRHTSFAIVRIGLSASGLPAGQGTTVFNPSGAGGSVATLDIYASPNVPTGNYTLTLTGTGTIPSTGNAITRTATMVIKVVP